MISIVSPETTGSSGTIGSPQTPPTIKEQIEAGIVKLKNLNLDRIATEIEKNLLIALQEGDDDENLQKVLEDIEAELEALKNQ